MLKIRLRRMGAKNRPFYRVVVSDSRQVPTGAAIEEIGYYDPLQDPPTVEIKKDRVEHWVSQGAGLSSTVRDLLRRA